MSPMRLILRLLRLQNQTFTIKMTRHGHRLYLGRKIVSNNFRYDLYLGTTAF